MCVGSDRLCCSRMMLISLVTENSTLVFKTRTRQVGADVSRHFGPEIGPKQPYFRVHFAN